MKAPAKGAVSAWRAKQRGCFEQQPPWWQLFETCCKRCEMSKAFNSLKGLDSALLPFCLNTSKLEVRGLTAFIKAF